MTAPQNEQAAEAADRKAAGTIREDGIPAQGAGISAAADPRTARDELLRWLSYDFFDRKIPEGYIERIDAALAEAAAAERERNIGRLQSVLAITSNQTRAIGLRDAIAILAELTA